MIAENEIYSSRILEAPVRRVYQAFAQPQHLRNWWGPEGSGRTHLLDALANSAKQLGVLPKVLFTGRVSHHELPDYICLGEIFAMPVRSRFSGLEVEGLGIVYLEASACGLPVIVGNSGGAVDAVLDKSTFPPADHLFTETNRTRLITY